MSVNINMADNMKFVSKSELDAKKQKRREEREFVLRKAKEKFDRKQRELDEKRERGEDVWILPSLSKRLSGDVDADETEKQTKKHKVGKKKKKKKKLEKASSPEDEWVEKDSDKQSATSKKEDEVPCNTQTRESWMLLPLSTKSEKKEDLVRKETKIKENVEEPEIDQMGKHPKELNPFWKKGGSGLPSEKSSNKGSVSGNRAWFKRAYERAKQQAEEEGRSLEDIAAERWGSLDKLKALAGEDDDEGRRNKNDSNADRRHKADGSPRNRPKDLDYDQLSTRRRDEEREFEKRGFRKPGERQSSNKPREKDLSKLDKKYNEFREKDRRKDKQGRWKKGEKRQPAAIKDREPRDSSSDSSSSSDEEVVVVEEEKVEKQECKDNEPISSKRVTEADLNAVAAKRLKAELLGDEDLAEKLGTELEKLKRTKEDQEKRSERNENNEANENVVILTRTDRSGNVIPVEQKKRDGKHSNRRKRHKQVVTHDEEGKRTRYFYDDDNYDLNSLVAREKMNTAEDQNAAYARIAHKLGGQFELDDKFESAAASKYTPEELEEKARQKAVREHQRLAAQMDNCKYCLENQNFDKHLVIAIGLKVYLALPANKSLCDGHCLLIPIMHHCAATMVDEDVWSEIQIFKKGLTQLFLDMEKDVVFMEMYRQINKKRHMLIECIPIEKEIGDMAPIYFKKAIQESDSEWAQNKKVIDTRTKNIRSSVPKGLPYFSVEFGLDGGFAHVIENEELVPPYFGQEIVGGMLELEPFIWKKPQKETFQVQKKKVLQFADWWKPYDWTQRIQKK